MPLMSPMCGELIIVRRMGEVDYVSGCWAEPEHEGPHLVVLAADADNVPSEEGEDMVG